jgi:hypothetical protein
MIKESYNVNGEIVMVEISSDLTTFHYDNGTYQSLPTDEVKFCPHCQEEGEYPFSIYDLICPHHGVEMVRVNPEKLLLEKKK